jgi:hypothetical protein
MYTVLDKYVERQVACPGELMFQCRQTEEKGKGFDLGKIWQAGKGWLGQRKGKLKTVEQ